MKLVKVVSGGQTGADTAGLEVAKELGLETGGYCPARWRTEDGSNPKLAEYGLVCTVEYGYWTRTQLNAQHSRATVWFGTTTSRGYQTTLEACALYGREMAVNPTPEKLRAMAETYEVINCAGNRASINPSAAYQTKTTFRQALKVSDESPT